VAPKPTINDVARAAGVSKGAVSFALNDRPGVAPHTRERILTVARDLGWTPSSRARALSVSRALAVGLVVARAPETLRADPFFPSFIAGMESVLSEKGQALLLQVSPDHEGERRSYRRLADEGRVDGVVITDLYVDDPRPHLLAELGLPAVVVGPAVDDEFWPSLGVDDAPGISAVVQHLVELGHEHIAHVSGPLDMVHGCSRADAWANSLRAARLPKGRCVEADFSAEAGARATVELLESDPPPTAIVYANDLMAMAGMSLALSRGVDVPGDLSITGYDDTEISAYLRPSLTTVSTDVTQWGRAAAAALLDVIDQRPMPRASLEPPRLVVRNSTGRPNKSLRNPRGATPKKRGRPARGRSRTE
jgi:LacI family transcriptional regulator, repressor for deo operon, udp, cdd, tsx, nupC, and nupG